MNKASTIAIVNIPKQNNNNGAQTPGKKKKKKSKTKGQNNNQPKSIAMTSMMGSATPRSFRVPKQMSGMSAKDCLAMCTPFNDSHKNCRYPDGNGQTLFPLKLRSLYDVVAAGGGVPNIIFFSTDYPFNVLKNFSLAGSVYTMDANRTTTGIGTALPNTLMGGTGAQFRINCAGIIFRVVMNAMTAAGTFTITKRNIMPGVSSNTTANQMYSAETATYAVTAGREVAVLFSPNGSLARDTTAMANIATTSSNTGWDVIAVEFHGTPSGTVLTAETFTSVECELNAESTSYQELNTAPVHPDSPIMKTAISRIQVAAGSIFDGGVTVVENKLKSLLRGAMVAAAA